MGMPSSMVLSRCSSSDTVNLNPLLAFGMGTMVRGENIKMMEEGVDVVAVCVCVKFTHIRESRSTMPRGSPRLT